MLTSEERLSIGLKALESIKPLTRPQSQRSQHSYREETSTIESDFLDHLEEEFLEERKVSSLVLPSLHTLLSQIGPLSPFAIVLGSCEDGLPFLLDLTNPVPGALLITGDPGCGKTRLLRSMLASSVLLNTPEQVAFSILTQSPNEYLDLGEAQNCLELAVPEEKVAGALVRTMVAATEKSRPLDADGPATILAIDDLAGCLQSMDEQTLNCLHWLVSEGSRYRVWVIATLSSEQADLIDKRILAAFRTRLVGRILAPECSSYLAGDTFSGAQDLAAGYQFSVPFGEEWIRFWICDAD